MAICLVGFFVLCRAVPSLVTSLLAFTQFIGDSTFRGMNQTARSVGWSVVGQLVQIALAALLILKWRGVGAFVRALREK
jgi:hypothetical protein